MDQFFVIARVGKTHRSLAATSLYNARGYGLAHVCLRLIQIFSDPANRITLKQELTMAAEFFNDFTEENHFDGQTMPLGFSFITACLLTGVGYNPKNWPVRDSWCEVRQQRYNAPQTAPLNNVITVLDITDLENISYCFLTPGKLQDRDDFEMESSWGHPPLRDPEPYTRPQTCSQYVSRHIERNLTRVYYDNEDKVEGDIINTFENIPLVTVRALQDVWMFNNGFQGHFPLQPDDQSPKRGPKLSLRWQAVAKLCDSVSSAEISPSYLYDMDWMPGFRFTVKEYLLRNKDRVGVSQSWAPILEVAYAGEAFLEWHHFKNLSSQALKAVFNGDILSKVTGISLSPPSAPDTPKDVVEALSILKTLDTLQVLDYPSRRDESMSIEMHESLTKLAPGLVKKSLVLSHFYSWEPLRALPVRAPKALAAFPVFQILLSYADWSPEVQNRRCLNLGDAFLTPVEFVAGLLQFLKLFLSGAHEVLASMDAFRCFAYRSSSLDGSHSRSRKIGPVPAELCALSHCSTGDHWYKNMELLTMSDLTPGTWTVVLKRKGRGNRLECFEYAFVRSGVTISTHPENWRGFGIEPSEIEVVDIEGFLKLMAPDIDSSQLPILLEELKTSLPRILRRFRTENNQEDSPALRLLEVQEVCEYLNSSVAETLMAKRIPPCGCKRKTCI
ncbi:hypothetical protein BKA56DRAFT_609077 [Ilyonectria sp. MPI-CAGE-AT-0026]|nr:hypothetical protein BKA56DRAFT_609077 [Ilyonectria sp. MPI-CAGE-AT-0026]